MSSGNLPTTSKEVQFAISKDFLRKVITDTHSGIPLPPAEFRRTIAKSVLKYLDEEPTLSKNTNTRKLAETVLKNASDKPPAFRHGARISNGLGATPLRRQPGNKNTTVVGGKKTRKLRTKRTRKLY